MGKGIQIKKPDRQNADSDLVPLSPVAPEGLSPLFQLMVWLTFPAAIVALYFFFQTRVV